MIILGGAGCCPSYHWKCGDKKKNTGTIWYNPVDFLFRPFNLKNYSFNVIYQLFILASNCLHCLEASRDSCLPYNPRFLAALDTCASAAQTFRQRPGGVQVDPYQNGRCLTKMNHFHVIWDDNPRFLRRAAWFLLLAFQNMGCKQLQAKSIPR